MKISRMKRAKKEREKRRERKKCERNEERKIKCNNNKNKYFSMNESVATPFVIYCNQNMAKF